MRKMVEEGKVSKVAETSRGVGIIKHRPLSIRPGEPVRHTHPDMAA